MATLRSLQARWAWHVLTMTAWMLLSILAFLIVLVIAMMIGRYARLRRAFTTVAAKLCEPATWSIRFFMRTFVIRGKVQGYPMRFSASGDVRGAAPAHAYLLIEYPVRGNFRFYKGSDVTLVHQDIRAQMETIHELPDFYALTVTTEATPWPAKVLARPLGLGYRPGLLMATFGTAGFDADALQHKFSLLIALAESGV